MPSTRCARRPENRSAAPTCAACPAARRSPGTAPQCSASSWNQPCSGATSTTHGQKPFAWQVCAGPGGPDERLAGAGPRTLPEAGETRFLGRAAMPRPRTTVPERRLRTATRDCFGGVREASTAVLDDRGRPKPAQLRAAACGGLALGVDRPGRAQRGSSSRPALRCTRYSDGGTPLRSTTSAATWRATSAGAAPRGSCTGAMTRRTTTAARTRVAPLGEPADGATGGWLAEPVLPPHPAAPLGSPR